MLRSELGNRLTLMERFERGKRDENSERRFRSHIERVLKGYAGILDRELECRDHFCRLHVLTGDGDHMEWLRMIQEDKEMRGLFIGMQAIGGSPDAGETGKWDDAVFQLRAEDDGGTLRP
jgi:hypothetical protein